jgi:tetratricopeptide (TPR) repeat protein|uniref:Tetratricopeptide repeat protein n=1 Tax=candidate division WOR-3 bacterium TaxID=2052148 RepID=A0A7C3UQ45_UNCW3
MRKVSLTLLGVITIILWLFSITRLQLILDKKRKKPLRELLVEELAYFPSGKFLKPMVIEYENLAADLVWLRAIQYYGHHLMTDRRYTWLGHIFSILTQLDPKFIGAYRFGGMTLAWDAGEPEEAINLLRRGMRFNPLRWELPFDIAFIYYMISRDYEKAGDYFYIASKMPETWGISHRWAAFSYGRTEKRREFGKILFQDLYESTKNPEMKRIARRGLKFIKREEDMEYLQKGIDNYYQKYKKYPADLKELLASGFIDSIPKEPTGGFYTITFDQEGKAKVSYSQPRRR